MIFGMESNVRPNVSGDFPQVDPSAFVDPSACVIGAVEIGADVYIGPGAIIRADELGPDGSAAPIVIGQRCNVQDGVIIHTLSGAGVTVGAGTSIAHGAIIHGPCEVSEGCFVGFGAVVFRANVGAGAFISARAVVQGADIPAGVLVPIAGVVTSADEAGRMEQTGPAEKQFMQQVVATNVKLAAGYLQQDQCAAEL